MLLTTRCPKASLTELLLFIDSIKTVINFTAQRSSDFVPNLAMIVQCEKTTKPGQIDLRKKNCEINNDNNKSGRRCIQPHVSNGGVK